MIVINDIKAVDRSNRQSVGAFRQRTVAEYGRPYPVTYILRCGERGPVKIGFAEDAVKRILQFQTGHHEPLYLVRWLLGGQQTERWLHDCFGHCRVRGEWFDLVDGMLSVGLPDFGLLKSAHLPLAEWPKDCLDVDRETFVATIAEFQRLAERYNKPARDLHRLLWMHRDWATSQDATLGQALGVYGPALPTPQPSPGDQPASPPSPAQSSAPPPA